MNDLEIRKALNKLEDLVKVQCADGNWNYDPYMHGMANGMLLVQALLYDKEPKFLEAPKEWLRDKKETYTETTT